MGMKEQTSRCGPLRAGAKSGIRSGAVALAGLLVLTLAAALPANAQFQVTGRVTAVETGAPLPGVQVVLKDSTGIGTTTGPDGRYTLTVRGPQNTIVFSKLGYTQMAVPIDGRSVVDVQMGQEAQQLDALVVIGYGEKRKANLTESVGTVSAQEVNRVPIASPEMAIQGHVPGIQIQSESGLPGAPVQVRIRGVGTIGNTQPLFVIDGLPVGQPQSAFESPLSSINPQDIESISVLKDASAAAVYGVQAANGVVLITTKRGKFGKPTFHFDGYTGVQNFPKTYDVLNSQQWFDLAQESYDNYNAQFGYTPDSASYQSIRPYLQQRRDQLLRTNTDWFDVVNVANAPISNATLSVSGATDNVNYYVSGGAFQQDAMLQKWNLDRLSFRANSDFTVSKALRFGENFAMSNEHTLRGQQNGFNGQLLVNALRLPPFFMYQDTLGVHEGNRYGYTGNADFAQAQLTFGNEPALNQLIDRIDRRTRVLGGLYGELEPIRGLKLKSQASLDYLNTRNTGYNPAYTVQEIGLDRGDQGTESRDENSGIVWTNTATYDGRFGEHAFTLLGGIESQQFHGSHLDIDMGNYLTTDPAYRIVIANGQTQNGPPRGYAGESAYLGYIGRVSYNYADRYLLTGSVRRDGASAFAPSNRWGTFPSFSAGWRIGQESWVHVPWVSELKLRGGWGRLGNSNVPGAAYAYLFQIWDSPDYAFGNTPVRVPVPRYYANEDVTWETNETADFGVESSLFDNRVDFSATYYRRNTHNFLVNVPLPLSSGFQDTRTGQGGAPFNTGLVRNSGFELEGGYHTRMLGAVSLDVSGNLTTVRNRLMSLAEGIDEYSQQGVYRTSVGYPIGYFYGYQTCGIYQTAAAAAAAPQDKTIGNNKPQAGDVCFQDVRGPYEIDPETGRKIETPPDGIIDANDRSYLGKTIPDLYYGINLNSTYRQFDLGLLFTGVGGVQKFNQVRQSIASVSGGGANRSTEVLNHWTGEGTSNTMPRAVVGDPNQNDRFSDRWVENGSYLRLRSVQLGYRLPNNLFGTSTSDTRLYVSGTNLFTITPYRGLDPEFSTSIDFGRSNAASQLAAGTDTGNLPQPRMWQIGLSTSF